MSIRNIDTLRSRLKGAMNNATANGLAKVASAPTAPGAPETDPNDKGGVTIDKDPDAAPAKQHIPASNENTDGGGQDHSELLKVTKPEGVLDSATPGLRDGNAKEDAATSPTTSLDKIASLTQRLRSALNPTKAAAEAAAAPAPVAAESLSAGIDNSAEGFAKLATIVDRYHRIFTVLGSTEAGANFIEETIRKQAGIEAAQVMLKEAAESAQTMDVVYDELVQRQAYEQQEMYKQASEVAEFENYFNALAPEDQTAIVKTASVHKANIDALETQLEKMAYAQGAEDAAVMADGGDIAGAQGIEEAPPSPEELMSLLQMLVESGQITEEDAAQIAEIIVSEGGAPAGDEGGMPAGDAAALGAEEVKQAAEIMAELAL